MPVHRTAAHPHVATPPVESAAARVPLSHAVPALLARLADVATALDGGPAPFPPPGFAPVPDGPPSRRERALLVHFAWTTYTVFAGRPPADRVPDEWPYRLHALVPLGQRRPDLLPALGRLIDRILTAPPLAPLPSPAGLEELLRRALARVEGDGTMRRTPSSAPPGSTPVADVIVEVDFRPDVPEPPAAVIARLRLLAGVLASGGAVAPLDVRRGLFRLGWTGWERLHGEPPYRHDRPYELQLNDPTPLAAPRVAPIAPPPALVPLLGRLLAQAADADIPSVPGVRAALAAMAAPADTGAASSAPPAEASAVVDATAREAERMLDALVAEGLVRSGITAATAQSMPERLAVTSLAWSVYRAASGTPPVVVEDPDDGTASPYQLLRDVAPEVPPPLAAVVDATLAPDSPNGVPGVAAWLSAAMQAADWEPRPGTAPPGTAYAAASPSHPRAAPTPSERDPRRRIQLLPDDTLTPSRLVLWPWVATAALGLTALRLFGGP